MKVYIVVKINNNKCEIDNVYSDYDAADYRRRYLLRKLDRETLPIVYHKEVKHELCPCPTG
jgi:hypothetical protein